MTLRAVLMGLLGALLLASTEYVRQEVWKFNSLIGNHLPRGLLGLLVLGILAINPLLRRIKPAWHFRPAELAMVLTLTMMAAGVVGPALLSSFTPALAMPAQHAQSMVGWREHGLLEMTPPILLPAGGRYDSRVLEGFLSGSQSSFSLSHVPWAQWAGPLSYWMPMVLLLGVASISLSLIVHRQWTAHERLRYPIADFASQLINQDSRGVSSILSSRMFLIGLCLMGTVHLVNALAVWMPAYIISGVPMQLDFTVIGTKFQAVRTAPWWPGIFNPTLIPSAVAFAFFLAPDVGLTLGLSHVLYMLVVKLVMEPYGLPRYEADLVGGANAYIRFGGSVSLAAMLLYTGRRHYWMLLKGALGARSSGAEGYSIWALRLLLISAAGIVAMLISVGLDWPVAILCVLAVLLIFLVVSRVTVESGMYMFRLDTAPVAVALGLYGGYALGPTALIIAGLFSTLLVVRTNGAFMPYVVNSLKIVGDQGVKPGRFGSLAGFTFAACLVVGIVATLATNYNYGVKHSPGNWETDRVPKMTYNVAQREMDRLKVTGDLEASKSMTTFERLKHVQPTELFSYSALIGAALVLALSMLRLRFLWWPLHPFIVVFWGTWPLALMSMSFLLGWIIKTVLVRLGGGTLHQKGKELMIGVIAGDVLGMLLLTLVPVVYKIITTMDLPAYTPN